MYALYFRQKITILREHCFGFLYLDKYHLDLINTFIFWIWSLNIDYHKSFPAFLSEYIFNLMIVSTPSNSSLIESHYWPLFQNTFKLRNNLKSFRLFQSSANRRKGFVKLIIKTVPNLVCTCLCEFLNDKNSGFEANDIKIYANYNILLIC